MVAVILKARAKPAPKTLNIIAITHRADFAVLAAQVAAAVVGLAAAAAAVAVAPAHLHLAVVELVVAVAARVVQVPLAAQALTTAARVSLGLMRSKPIFSTSSTPITAINWVRFATSLVSP